MTSIKYCLVHPVELDSWELLQIFYGSAYFNLEGDFYRIGVNETPVLLVFIQRNQYAYLTITRNVIGKVPDRYIGFDLELSFKDEPDLNLCANYLSSLTISDKTPDSYKLRNVIALQRETGENLQIAAILFNFCNGKNLYVYDNDLADGLIFEFNSKTWLTDFTSRYDL